MFFLPVITLIILYVVYHRQNSRQFGSINFLITVYLLMGLFSIIMELTNLFPSVYPYSWYSMTYLSLCFILTFKGFYSYKDSNFKTLIIENKKTYVILENIIMIGGFSSLLFFLPFASNSLSGDVEVNRLTTAIFQETVLAKFGVINTFFSLFANLFIIAILFAFINFTDQTNSQKKIKGYLLLASSISYVVYVLAYVGRDGIVYWSFTYLFLYLLLRKFISSSLRKKLIVRYLFVVGLFMVPFMIISFARFSEAFGGVSWQLLDYVFGQQIKNFNDSFYVDSPILNGQFSYPIFSDIFRFFGFNFEKLKVQDIFPYYLAYGVDPGPLKLLLVNILWILGKLAQYCF